MSSSSSRYIHSVDGLRAVAVLAVLLYHLGIDWIPGGFLGVDLFFVISGYVITGLILDSIARLRQKLYAVLYPIFHMC